MAVQASLGKNFIMNILLAASSLIFPLITYPYVSRILLPDGTGRVAFAVSVVSYFTMTASLGIPTYGIRVCAGVRDDKKELSQTVQEIFLINAVMTLLVCLVFAFCLAFVPKFQDDRALSWSAGSHSSLTWSGWNGSIRRWNSTSILRSARSPLRHSPLP